MDEFEFYQVLETHLNSTPLAGRYWTNNAQAAPGQDIKIEVRFQRQINSDQLGGRRLQGHILFGILSDSSNLLSAKPTADLIRAAFPFGTSLPGVGDVVYISESPQVFTMEPTKDNSVGMTPLWVKFFTYKG